MDKSSSTETCITREMRKESGGCWSGQVTYCRGERRLDGSAALDLFAATVLASRPAAGLDRKRLFLFMRIGNTNSTFAIAGSTMKNPKTFIFSCFSLLPA